MQSHQPKVQSFSPCQGLSFKLHGRNVLRCYKYFGLACKTLAVLLKLLELQEIDTIYCGQRLALRKNRFLEHLAVLHTPPVCMSWKLKTHRREEASAPLTSLRTERSDAINRGSWPYERSKDATRNSMKLSCLTLLCEVGPMGLHMGLHRNRVGALRVVMQGMSSQGSEFQKASGFCPQGC